MHYYRDSDGFRYVIYKDGKEYVLVMLFNDSASEIRYETFQKAFDCLDRTSTGLHEIYIDTEAERMAALKG